MANTRGGLIVFGIREQGGTGRAEAISPIDTSESVQRRLRALASQIAPLVAGIQIDSIDGADAGNGVVILSVPPSADAPHLISDGQWVGVPYRVGPETAWMRERDIERAYRTRFAEHADEQERLRNLVAELGERVDLTERLWIAGVTRPRAALPSIAPTARREEVGAILTNALAQIASLKGPLTSAGMLRQMPSDSIHNPRVGLRRWVVEDRGTGTPDALAKDLHVELHRDGTVGFAASIEGWYAHSAEGLAPVPVPFVEEFAVDLVGLTLAYGSFLGLSAPVSCRLDFLRGDERGLAALDNQRVGNMTLNSLNQPSWSRTLRRFIPVMTELPAPADLASALAAARDLATDVLSQFGIGTLGLIPAELPSR